MKKMNMTNLQQMAKQRRNLFVNWNAINGAANGKRKLVLRSNDKGTFTCPIKLCLHSDYKSQRGLRKHIDNIHPWYYYFDQQPEIKREEVEQLQPAEPRRASTANIPHYSMDDGIGKDFLRWLCTSCGGGKTEREAKQIAKRALKFLMESTGSNDSGLPLTNELIDCCLGSPSILIKFLETLETEWKLKFSGLLTYVKAITDLLDFRKSNGVSDNNLRSFTVTEVYLRRAKENFRKKKHLESTRNFDLESLIARDSWATIEEMENVIPFHINRFKEIVEKCKSQAPLPTKQEQSFCTRFVTTFLFLRVKCSRPMTFQYLTLPMIDRARVNDGFIDQKEFKTSSKYLFDTLIVSAEVFTILDAYIDNVRPLFNPSCDFLLVSQNGTQYKSLTAAMTMLVYEAIGKHIHPTRYRQIVETASAQRLSREEQETISEDQKHSSMVAKVHYKKVQSRHVALKGKKCMEKMLGDVRAKKNSSISGVFDELKQLALEIPKDNHPVLQTAARILTTPTSSPYSSCTISKRPEVDHLTETAQRLLEQSPAPLHMPSLEPDCDMVITKAIPADPTASSTISYSPSTVTNVQIKKECADKESRKLVKNIKFTIEEDSFLLEGMKKHGNRNWSSILKDKAFTFHKSRTRDSLRMRADSKNFKASIIKVK